jgi:hypothetical protein
MTELDEWEEKLALFIDSRNAIAGLIGAVGETPISLDYIKKYIKTLEKNISQLYMRHLKSNKSDLFAGITKVKEHGN